ncbi:hypothetical protein RYZ26_07620 [Terasakiella sp. A23]|uniref:hypothetical protein n=1 Tax=Terasakiella sp. FCG-A23 TaxID=3080561 RepID=UPI0029534F81|nr:hypothetical protein [Terasakiella sp. A23]MDV7339455.1 hypothetical protein [Terasakiella sp. A23]
MFNKQEQYDAFYEAALFALGRLGDEKVQELSWFFGTWEQVNVEEVQDETLEAA